MSHWHKYYIQDDDYLAPTIILLLPSCSIKLEGGFTLNILNTLNFFHLDFGRLIEIVTERKKKLTH